MYSYTTVKLRTETEFNNVLAKRNIKSPKYLHAASLLGNFCGKTILTKQTQSLNLIFTYLLKWITKPFDSLSFYFQTFTLCANVPARIIEVKHAVLHFLSKSELGKLSDLKRFRVIKWSPQIKLRFSHGCVTESTTHQPVETSEISDTDLTNTSPFVRRFSSCNPTCWSESPVNLSTLCPYKTFT